jgi:hypothetical protein
MTSGKPEVLNPTTRTEEDRLSELEMENSRLQRLVVELLLKNQSLREALLFPSKRHRNPLLEPKYVAFGLTNDGLHPGHISQSGDEK